LSTSQNHLSVCCFFAFTYLFVQCFNDTQEDEQVRHDALADQGHEAKNDRLAARKIANDHSLQLGRLIDGQAAIEKKIDRVATSVAAIPINVATSPSDRRITISPPPAGASPPVPEPQARVVVPTDAKHVIVPDLPFLAAKFSMNNLLHLYRIHLLDYNGV
jgi:hypothetical protein